MTNLAYSAAVRPSRTPLEAPTRTRHIEIVSTRTQRRARPRTIYALVTVAGLFVILMAQLLLSIVLSDGAYQISALQAQQTELSRDTQTYTEQLDVLKVQPLNQLGTPAEIIARFGNREQYLDAVREMEHELYTAA